VRIRASGNTRLCRRGAGVSYSDRDGRKLRMVGGGLWRGRNRGPGCRNRSRRSKTEGFSEPLLHRALCDENDCRAAVHDLSTGARVRVSGERSVAVGAAVGPSILQAGTSIEKAPKIEAEAVNPIGDSACICDCMSNIQSIDVCGRTITQLGVVCPQEHSETSRTMSKVLLWPSVPARSGGFWRNQSESLPDQSVPATHRRAVGGTD